MTRLKVYIARHLQVFFSTLGELVRAPFSNMMTIAVIGIALALPTGLHVLLQNVQQVSAQWDGAAQISLFLHQQTTDKQVEQLAGLIRKRQDVSTVTSITREAALEEFRQNSGFGEALDALEDNPFPPVIVVYPTSEADNIESVQAMLKMLGERPEVEHAQLDMQWLKRLYTIMDIGRRGIWVLATLLSISVLLVVGNTIRLAIESRREEIEIIKLIGGTNAFIRRPFLYTGFWYGLTGGVISWLLITTSLWLLGGPVNRLATLYDSHYALAGLDLAASLGLLGASILLGLGGSWLAVTRHLHAIEPQ
ncbi:permease-like cell division protein FtsX [Sulfuriflexus sp.]|uniref:permease-like cell division protein FtsX n=1 Tax=Sulfuriflexus sp. TaxID=2015443 RepID=UPI0028CD0E39|nr:permease-like cell division protein FtsX [Sulfuriflexus sp.]MDT8403573.1 permease-like cell division protein FtsX [Sulfuriflexus sp.]